MTSLNELVEESADDTPRGVSHGCRGRDVSSTAEDDGHVDVSEVGPGPFSCCEIDEDWCDETDEEEPGEGTVDTFCAEDALWTNDSPNDRCGEEHSCIWTGVVVYLAGLTDTVNGTEGPVVDGDLDNTRPESRYKLGPEGNALWDFHVMGKFDVLSEVEALVCCDVAVHLEHHHGERPSGLHVTNDEFGNDVEANLHVRCGLDDPDREVEKE